MSLGGIDPLFNIYSKITDTLLYFDDKYKLDFTVQLMKKSKDNKVMPFHSEYQYYSESYGQDVVSVKRNFSYGLILNPIQYGNNESIYIRPKDISVMKWIFENKIFRWFVGDEVFILRDGRLEIVSNVQVEIPLSETSMLLFSPMVIDYEDDTSKEGCRMYINNFDTYINMTMDKFFEFNYYISNVDLYNVALNMLNYIKTGPYGVNRSSFDSSKGPLKKSQSYFDKG